MGAEGSRRGPSRINKVEDVLRELVRNSRDAGARNVYVASVLKGRRYRILTILDDGHGIPESHRDLAFEPGVTTRHLTPIQEPDLIPNATPHGAGLSLFHIRRAAINAEFTSPSSPTVIRVILDTNSLPERALQSGSRPSRSNQEATLRAFLHTASPSVNAPNIYLASPARILATILNNRIIHSGWLTDDRGSDVIGIAEFANDVGLEVSSRTIRRVMGGKVPPAFPLSRHEDEVAGKREKTGLLGVRDGPSLALGPGEVREISAILSRTARAGYLDIGELKVQSRAGEIILKASVFEPEDEYE
jgi:hypothetical protein